MQNTDKLIRRRAIVFALKIAVISLLLASTALALHILFENIRSDLDSGTVFSENHKPTVIVDAGHGGMDGGAVSVTGTPEKVLNLDVARRLQKLLEAAGCEVIMTRTEDFMPDSHSGAKSAKQRDLQARLEFTKQYPDAILVSIHMNKFTEAKYSGMQVWYSPDSPRSAALAEAVRNSDIALLQPENKRECKEANSSIFLLWKSRIPSVLVECGFLSNPDEAALLDTPEYRSKIAAVIFSAIISENGSDGGT